MSEMIGAGMHAIIIKVAGIGLAPNHLGKTLGEMQPTLVKLVRPLIVLRVAFCDARSDMCC
jgi:diphthamide synthase (EF-2-diphthine--ammonia ligase)